MECPIAPVHYAKGPEILELASEPHPQPRVPTQLVAPLLEPAESVNVEPDLEQSIATPHSVARSPTHETQTSPLAFHALLGRDKLHRPAS
jgi:hypothetical protein